MDAEKLKAMLDEQTPQIVAEVRAKVVATVARDVEHTIAALSVESIKEWFKENVAPQIVQALNDDKSIIIEAVRKSSADIAILLATKMTEQATENLQRSWNIRDITTKLFG